MRKPAFCICENKGADQLHSICAADQRLKCHSIIPLLPFKPLAISSVAVQLSLCQTWWEILKIGFVIMQLIYSFLHQGGLKFQIGRIL